MGKCEADYQIKCKYSDILFDRCDLDPNGSLTSSGSIIQHNFKIKFTRVSDISFLDFNVSAHFPDMRMYFSSEDELEREITKKILKTFGYPEWQSVK